MLDFLLPRRAIPFAMPRKKKGEREKKRRQKTDRFPDSPTPPIRSDPNEERSQEPDDILEWRKQHIVVPIHHEAPPSQEGFSLETAIDKFTEMADRFGLEDKVLTSVQKRRKPPRQHIRKFLILVYPLSSQGAGDCEKCHSKFSTKKNYKDLIKPAVKNAFMVADIAENRRLAADHVPSGHWKITCISDTPMDRLAGKAFRREFLCYFHSHNTALREWGGRKIRDIIAM